MNRYLLIIPLLSSINCAIYSNLASLGDIDSYVALNSAELDTVERSRREGELRKLEDHVQNDTQNVNAIHIEFTMKRSQDMPETELWNEMVSYVLEVCRAAADQPWVNQCDVSIRKPSNSSDAHFGFGSEEMGIMGDIQVTLGASDCCTDCYPECHCTPRKDGTCPCTAPKE